MVRTGKYAIWKACERLRVNPPGLSAVGRVNWDDLRPHQQADILAYHQIAEHDEPV